MTDTPNFYFFNKKKSSVTAFILDLSINGIFEAWKILVAEKEIILAQEYRLFLIRLPIYMGKMALTQKSAIIGRFSRMSNSDSLKCSVFFNIDSTSITAQPPQKKPNVPPGRHSVFWLPPKKITPWTMAKTLLSCYLQQFEPRHGVVPSRIF